MTILEFEEFVMDVFVTKGWAKEHLESGLSTKSWFKVKYTSLYKKKEIEVIREINKKTICLVSDDNFNDAFKKCLKMIEKIEEK